MEEPPDCFEDVGEGTVPPERLTPAETAQLMGELQRERRRRRQAEEALHAQTLVLESMAEGVVITDQRGIITYTNPAFDAMFGYERGELTGRPSGALNAYPPEENLRIVKEILRTVAAAGAWVGEFHNRTKDGRLLFTKARISALTAGGKKSFLAVQEDITAGKRTQAALEESEARYRTLVELSPDAILVHARGRYVFVNAAAVKLFGAASSQELLGQRVLDLVHPDSKETVRRRIQTGERLDLREVKILRLDGKTLEVEVAATPITYYGQPVVQVVLRDITKRKQAAKDLRESEERYRSLFENNHAVMYLIDPDTGIIMDVNPAACAYYGYDRKELAGRSITGINTMPMEQVFLAMQEAKAGKRERFEFKHRLAGGVVRDVEVYSGPIKVGGRALLYSIVHDITNRKEAEEALRRVHNDLEERVAARTADLRAANEHMLREIEERQWIEEKLRDSETRFAAFMEHLPGLAVMRDIEGRYLFANPAWEKMMGFAPGGWRGKTLDEVWHPSQAAALARLDFQVLSSGESTERVERLRLDNGLHYFLTHRFPITDKHGLPFMVGLIAIDVTARQEAETALAEHAALVQDLYNNAPCGYHSLNPEGIIVQMNDTELAWLGYTREEVVGRLKLSDLLTPKSIKVFQGNFPKFKATGVTRDLEYEMVRKDGTILPVSLSATAVRDVAGNYVMSRSTLFDITERKKAEQALAAERQGFLDLLENLPAFVFLQAPDRAIRFANRQFRERFGAPGSEACQALLRGRDQISSEHPTFTVFHTWEAKAWEYAAPDGRIYQVYDYPFADADGSPLVLEMGIDITDRKRAEEVIREQGRQLEAFFAHGLTPVVFLDPNFNFLRVNEAYARACHRHPQDFNGHNLFEFFPNPEKQVLFAEAVRHKTPYQAQATPFKFPERPEWGVSYWDLSLTPILDPAGEVDFLVFSLRDVTKRVQAEQARGRLIEILEATPDFVGIADYHGNLLYLNRAGRDLVGVGEEEDITRFKVLELHPEWAGQRIMEKGTPTAIREGVWQAEIALLHRDGREIPVSQVILAHKEPTGRVGFFSTIARDISDIKKAQKSVLRQTAILNGINRIFREALASDTKEELGRTCLTIARLLTDSQFGFILELNRRGRFDSLAFSDPGREPSSKSPEAEPQFTNIKPAGLLAQTMAEGKVLIANDPAAYPEDNGVPGAYPALTSYLGMPLSSGDITLGLLVLGNKTGGHTQADREAVASLAPVIVEALMHRRAEEALQVSERRLRRLADQLLTAQENERKRLAAELHDELGHALLTLKLSLSSIEKKLPQEQANIKNEIRSQLDYIHEVIQDVRRLYHDLSPGDVEDLGLTKALHNLIEDFAGHQPDIAWHVNLADLEGLFSLPVQTTVYRIVQEALTNIGKHANPSTVAITSMKGNQQMCFTIEDDGAGFDVAQVLGARASQRGVGLVAMEERVHMAGGSFQVNSHERQGTRLNFTIPILPEGESA